MSAPSPDFRHIENWVFDLDHTLYSVDPEGHAAMAERICVYVQRLLDLPREPAWEIQKRYLKDYGSTLSGLVRHHGVDADHYHDFVNDIDALGLEADAALRAGLARLGGRRLIFTNNCGRYAAKVVERIGIADLFADIVDARAMNFVPKPNAGAYDTLMARGCVPAASAFFDDSPRNLLPAFERGMTTVWLSDSPAGWSMAGGAERELPHIQYRTDNLATFLHTIRI